MQSSRQLSKRKRKNRRSFFWSRKKLIFSKARNRTISPNATTAKPTSTSTWRPDCTLKAPWTLLPRWWPLTTCNCWSWLDRGLSVRCSREDTKKRERSWQWRKYSRTPSTKTGRWRSWTCWRGISWWRWWALILLSKRGGSSWTSWWLITKETFTT